MTTIEELLAMGLNQYNAEKILESYGRKVGTEHGDFTVVDMTYLGNNSCEVVFGCRNCGTKLVKHIKTGANRTKWNKLQRICDCHKEAIKEENEIKKIMVRKMAAERKQLEIESRIGATYGEFKIIGIENGNYVVQCQICGEIDNWKIAGLVQRMDLVCHKHRAQAEKFDESYIGRKNNYLTVIGITHDMRTGRKRFICKCDCGEKAMVKPTFWENGHVVSCGCYLAYRSIFTEPRERILGIWRGMKRRCCNPDDKSYPNYGGRGITICPEWLDFENFYAWSMANEYDNTKTLDREDWDGNYDPGNCRWTTWDVQCRNKRPRKSQKYYEDLKNGTTN